ncbi:hypothetical protein RQ831_19355 [Roseomonas gilardii]|uniref:Transposase n=1 Tax=Roseomonas gilardii TaxID=257708 RepID=A0ABU3MJL9_9PROT|nr:hypothetical protein [Roseomonas gilardii]MDT8333214.1 hypothetical protein [Roseomonas gilardii]
MKRSVVTPKTGKTGSPAQAKSAGTVVYGAARSQGYVVGVAKYGVATRRRAEASQRHDAERAAEMLDDVRARGEKLSRRIDGLLQRLS